MADFKRRTLTLSSGKQIKLYGNSIGIGKSLEVAEGYAPNIFSFVSNEEKEKVVPAVSNPHQLTAEEMYELVDYSIRLWLDLKDNIRKYGVNSPRVFNSDPCGKCKRVVHLKVLAVNNFWMTDRISDVLSFDFTRLQLLMKGAIVITKIPKLKSI